MDSASTARDLGSLNVRDFFEEAVHAEPDTPFLVTERETLSYAEFNRRAHAAAATWTQLGVRKGDRVAFLLGNSVEFLAAWFGLAFVGGILVALNTRWQREELAQCLSLTGPRLVLAGDEYGPAVQAAANCVPGPGRILDLSEFRAMLDSGGTYRPDVPLRSDDAISFIATSGTTGRSKAVIQTHGNYVLTGEGYAHWLQLRSGERIYLCLPLFHINSQAYSVMGAIAARGTVVLVERFSASRFWTDMARYGVNVFNFIGSMLAILVKREPSPEEREHAVRASYGGPAFPGPVREELERRFNLTLISGIGMSETTFGLIESLDGERRPGSLGRPRQHPDPRIVNEARVVDDTGRECGADEVGELLFRNPVMMKGYFRDEEGTARAIRDGWLYTGDLVRRDADGYFTFVDRKKDIVRVRGENVAPAEVEAVLADHPGVREAAVVGVPSELTDEEIVAFVVPAGGAAPEPDELIAHCAARLARFKVPRHLWLVDALPMTETLRVEKHRLREEAARRLRTRVPEGDPV